MSTATQKWLRNNVQPYQHSDRVYSDVDAALHRFQTLRPKADIYTYDDGRTQLLLCVHGLLPISFRNASYNIPIAVWLTRDYPRQPPIAYVVPTADMLVKAGKHIDVSGKCEIEFMQNWARKSEGCNLTSLLEAMQHQFSKEPPVYAKPPDTQQQQQRPPPPQQYTAHRPPPPLPTDRPVIPPKPIVPVTTPPPPPPRPLSDALPPQYRSYAGPYPVPNSDIHAPTSYASGSNIGPNILPSGSNVQSPGSNIQPLPATPPRPLHPSAQNPAAQPAFYYQPPPEIPTPPPPRPPPAVNLLDEDSPDPQTSYIPPSNLAPPPPRPPNPELLHLHNQVYHKLTSELSSLSQALALDAERLRAHQSDLLTGEPAIRDEMARLEAVRDVCRIVAGRMKGTVHQAEINVAELRRKGDPEVDELICSTTIVYNQLISLVAEDNAIEDTIYHLHRALNAGRIDLERFLRNTRLLAEEQFMKRALIEKIQAGIPMGVSMGSDWA